MTDTSQKPSALESATVSPGLQPGDTLTREDIQRAAADIVQKSPAAPLTPEDADALLDAFVESVDLGHDCFLRRKDFDSADYCTTHKRDVSECRAIYRDAHNALRARILPASPTVVEEALQRMIWAVKNISEAAEGLADKVMSKIGGSDDVDAPDPVDVAHDEVRYAVQDVKKALRKLPPEFSHLTKTPPTIVTPESQDTEKAQDAIMGHVLLLMRLVDQYGLQDEHRLPPVMNKLRNAIRAALNARNGGAK